METTIIQATQTLKVAYENISPSSIDQLTLLYSEDASFKDPFQEVIGRSAIKTIFLKMYTQLQTPQFIVQDILIKDHTACFLWEFKFQLKQWNTSPKSFTGLSWLEFNHDHLVSSHRDFWDPAEGLYEHLPLIGPLMKGLKHIVA